MDTNLVEYLEKNNNYINFIFHKVIQTQKV